MTVQVLPAVLTMMLSPVGQGSSALSCIPIIGSDLVLAVEAKRFIIVGENHGTNEIPSLFGDLICAALSRGPVVVGLEIQTDQQESLDRYMVSSGDKAARIALLSNKHWRSTDGRASEAMFQLIEQVRRLGNESRNAVLLRALMPIGSNPEESERAMGESWKLSLNGMPNARLLMLVGSGHAEREPMGNSIPAAHALLAESTLTLDFFPSSQRGIFLDAPPAWRWPHFDLHYSVGKPLSPSPMSATIKPAPSSPAIPPQQ